MHGTELLLLLFTGVFVLFLYFFFCMIVIVVVAIIMGTLNAICCIANDTENYRDIYLKAELVSSCEKVVWCWEQENGFLDAYK